LPELWGEVSVSPLVDRLFARPTATLTEEFTSGRDRVYCVTGMGARRAPTAVLMIEDVTARERRHRAQREFVANAAHELLTPLTGIVGAAHVLESGGKVDPETRDRFISHIARQCDRLARIARSLLVLARARSGEEPPRPELLPLRSLIANALEAAGLNDEDVHVEVDQDVDEMLSVFVDPDLAEQALTNLLANARRHSGEHPLGITAHDSAGHMVEIRIVDRGIGIFPEQLDRIQRRFATGAGRDSTGFGLGLSIAAQALELIDGTLSFESTPGEGTCAFVGLPSARLAAR
jgi:signal transduction histidine kinase